MGWEYRKRATVFPLLFSALLQFCKSAVRSNIVIVRVTFRLSLPHCNNARYSVYEYILQCIFTEVQTRLLLAERGGFEPPDTLPHRTLSKRVPSTTQPPLLGKCSTPSLYPRHCLYYHIAWQKSSVFMPLSA